MTRPSARPPAGTPPVKAVVDYADGRTLSGWVRARIAGELTVRADVDGTERSQRVVVADGQAGERVPFRITLPRPVSLAELVGTAVRLDIVGSAGSVVPIQLWRPLRVAAELQAMTPAARRCSLELAGLGPAANARPEEASAPALHAGAPVPVATRGPDGKAASATELIVVVAMQRSGTTALCRTLAQQPGTVSMGEIFHEARDAGDTALYDDLQLVGSANYFRFLEARLAADPSLSRPTSAHRERLLDAFLAQLKGDAGRLVLDVKYNSWHHFEGVWKGPLAPPALLRMLDARGATFVHLTRRNLLKRYASEVVAARRGRFHFATGEDIPDFSVRIAPARAVANVRDTARAIGLFESWLAGVGRVVRLAYEDLYEGDRLSAGATATLEALPGIRLDGVRVPLAKALPDVRRAVSNWDELVEAVNATEWAPFAPAD